MTDPHVLAELLAIDVRENDDVSLVDRRGTSIEFSIVSEQDGVPPELMEKFAHRNARLVVGSEFGNYTVFPDE